MPSLLNLRLFILDVIETSSFHPKSVDDNIIKNVGQRSCFTIAKTSNKNFFFPVIWCSFNTTHESKRLIISYKIFYPFLKTFDDDDDDDDDDELFLWYG